MEFSTSGAEAGSLGNGNLGGGWLIRVMQRSNQTTNSPIVRCFEKGHPVGRASQFASRGGHAEWRSPQGTSLHVCRHNGNRGFIEHNEAFRKSVRNQPEGMLRGQPEHASGRNDFEPADTEGPGDIHDQRKNYLRARKVWDGSGVCGSAGRPIENSGSVAGRLAACCRALGKPEFHRLSVLP